MDIRHLEYFVEVARQRSFTKAAQHLHITQPSISKMIKSMEEELGVTLFHRSGKQVELTDAGCAVLNQAQSILTSFQNLTSELADVVHLRKGHIRIGLPPMAGASFFTRAIGEFNKLYPNINIRLLEVGSKMVQAGVDEGSLDIGVVCSLPVQSEAFEMFPIVNDPLMVIVHPEHSLAEARIINAEDLANEPFVIYRQDFTLYDRIIERCAHSGFKPKIICESSQWDFMVEIVAAKLGIAFLPQKICKDLDPKRIKAIPLQEPHIYWELAVIWKKNRYLSYASRQWLNFTSTRFGVTLELKN